jgi:ribosome biogenesis protein Nip4
MSRTFCDSWELRNIHDMASIEVEKVQRYHYCVQEDDVASMEVEEVRYITSFLLRQ